MSSIVGVGRHREDANLTGRWVDSRVKFRMVCQLNRSENLREWV
jgi:hypothetical protein